MARRFKSSKRKNILFFLIFIIGISIILKFALENIIKLKIYKSNNDLITYLVMDNNNLLAQNKKSYLPDLISMTTNIDIKKPVSIIEKTISFSNYYLDDINEFLNKPKDSKEPVIYLYSSNFEKELINKNNYEINSTIMLIYILKGLLDRNKLSTDALNINLSELISLNSKDAYEISRLYLKEALDKYNIKLALDIQIGENESVVIDNKKFSKINFLINSNYEKNIENVNKLTTIISKKYPELINDNIEVENSLNEDINNVLVIQIGSKESTLEEIYNTFSILSNNIKTLLGDING